MIPVLCIALAVLGLRGVAADEGMDSQLYPQCVCVLQFTLSPQSAFAE